MGSALSNAMPISKSSERVSTIANPFNALQHHFPRYIHSFRCWHCVCQSSPSASNPWFSAWSSACQCESGFESDSAACWQQNQPSRQLGRGYSDSLIKIVCMFVFQLYPNLTLLYQATTARFLRWQLLYSAKKKNSILWYVHSAEIFIHIKLTVFHYNSN
jgi:hypothetical protein